VRIESPHGLADRGCQRVVLAVPRESRLTRHGLRATALTCTQARHGYNDDQRSGLAICPHARRRPARLAPPVSIAAWPRSGSRTLTRQAPPVNISRWPRWSQGHAIPAPAARRSPVSNSRTFWPVAPASRRSPPGRYRAAGRSHDRHRLWASAAWPRSGSRTPTRSAPPVSVSRLAAIRQVPPT